MSIRSTVFATAATVALAAALASNASAFEFAMPSLKKPVQQLIPAAPAPETSRNRPVLLAQASADIVNRLNQLEDEVRRLTGKVEDMSFQLLQAQEDMRKKQEDNEFRFQQLEGGGTSPGKSPQDQRRGDASSQGSTPVQAAGNVGGANSSIGEGSDNDSIGAVIGSTNDTDAQQAATPTTSGQAKSSSTVATLSPKDKSGMYDLAYNYLLAGDYQLAEQSFRQYSQTYPNAADAPDADYWLGESLYQQRKYADAAEVFLNAQKDHPQSGKAPEMMLKLGMSLAKLENRDTACVTYKEVAKRYPQMSANVKRKLEAEQKAASC